MSQDLVDLTSDGLEELINDNYSVPDPIEKEFKDVLREIRQAICMEIKEERRIKMLKMRTERWEEVFNKFGKLTGAGTVTISINEEEGTFDIVPDEDD